jgi:hypothetical protein
MVMDYAVIDILNEPLPSSQGIFGQKATAFTYEAGTGAGKKRSTIVLQRLGEWITPVDVLVTSLTEPQRSIHGMVRKAVTGLSFWTDLM